jgi:Xaa-Pro aminopeptidase
MFQTFDDPGGPQLGRAHLPQLRREMARLKLDGFVVPHEDEYQNEYVPVAYDRLAWLTGFTGSAGAAVVMREVAAIFVDGRYTLQVKAQVDEKLFVYQGYPEPGPHGWLADNAKAGERIGYDPRLFSPDSVERLRRAVESVGAQFVAVSENPIDRAWGDKRPPIPAAPVKPHPDQFTGEAHKAKRQRIGADIAKTGADATVLTSPASIAWLFNIRGGDVKSTPLPLGTGVLHADGRAELYLKPEKVSAELAAWLGNEVAIQDDAHLAEGLAQLGGKKVALDPSLASAWYFEQLHAAGAKIVRAADPIALPRACKNAVEIEGARHAHARDGAALSRFLHWLGTEAQSGKIDEIEAVSKLEEFRRATGKLSDVSFDSISGAGPNGAIVHYRVTKKTNRKLKRGTLFLIDSGGQYPDGTTDVTRTVAIGRPSPEMKDRFTRVLKGHIALSRVRFPVGTTGSQLDALARLSLWEAGLDYDHGTGHGVGSYLGVHEGPHRIAKPGNTVALQPGMIVSNEPGYYRTGAYGIRTENLQFVTEPAPVEGGEREMLGFETLTLAPIDRDLIVKKLLSAADLAWLNGYHARVAAVIGPQLDGTAKAWLLEVCKPI